jgi:hypothetical protein
MKSFVPMLRSRRACAAFKLAWLLPIWLGSTPASAQTLDDYTRRQIFDFEQCANLCQIDLDNRLFLCAPYREDKNRAAPENCFEDGYDRYDRCLKACPVDPRQ